MKTDFYTEYLNATGTNAKPAPRTFAHREHLGRSEDLDAIKQRAIRRLYSAAVDAGRYPVARPTVRLVSDPLSFTAPYVQAEVETL